MGLRFEDACRLVQRNAIECWSTNVHRRDHVYCWAKPGFTNIINQQQVNLNIFGTLHEKPSFFKKNIEIIKIFYTIMKILKYILL